MSLTSEQFALRESLENQPRLLRTRSKHSIAASEDYYSLSDRTSHAGDDADLLPPTRRIPTPPSRYATPEDDSNAARIAHPNHTLDQEKHFRRKAVGSGGPKELTIGAEPKSLRMDPNSRTYTPGNDDSQFIRFAIDQLTRDEEVRGSRTYPVREEEEAMSSTTEEYPSERNTYQNFSPQNPTTQYDDRRRPQTPLGIRRVPPEYPAQKPTLGLGEHDEISPIPVTPEPVRQQRLLAQQKELQAGPAPQHPLQGALTASSSGDLENNVFVAYDPLKPTTQQPRLDFVPGILRPLWLGIFILLCVLMLIGLLFCACWCLAHDGLWTYHRFGDNRYFVFEYLPQILGMIILVWLLQIQIAFIRIAPFMAMTSASTKIRSEAQFLKLYPTQFLFPKIEYFRAGQIILGICFFIFWLFLFTIPLLSSSFNARFYGPSNDGVWRWVAVQGVIWTVIVLYTLVIIALLLLLFKLRRSGTGLKWDPRSLADLIALLERSNFLNEYTGTEIYQHLGDFRQRLWNSTPRIGYWHSSHRPSDVFYGMGEEGGLTRRYSIEAGRIREKGHRYHASIDSREDPEHGAHSQIQLNYRHGVVRRRYLPWFLSSSSILAWVLVAFVLLIAFLVVAFVNQTTTSKGFFPKVRADTNSAGYSAANFLYSFVPGLIGLLLYLFWLPLDYAHRRLEPYRLMTTPNGATAEHSLLLDYPFLLPGSVTIIALTNRHWKIAYLSFISLINAVIPVLAGGIFWAQWYTNSTDVRITGESAGLYALCFFLALYAVSLLALAPGRTFIRMPHESACLAEIVSWLYQSPILLDRAFARCQTKTELQTRLLGERALRPTGFWASVTNLVHSFSREGLRGGAPLEESGNQKAKATMVADTLAPATYTAAKDAEKRGLSLEKALYGFGVYTGRDGRDHLGIDRVGRGLVLFDD